MKEKMKTKTVMEHYQTALDALGAEVIVLSRAEAHELAAALTAAGLLAAGRDMPAVARKLRKWVERLNK